MQIFKDLQRSYKDFHQGRLPLKKTMQRKGPVEMFIDVHNYMTNNMQACPIFRNCQLLLVTITSIIITNPSQRKFS